MVHRTRAMARFLSSLPEHSLKQISSCHELTITSLRENLISCRTSTSMHFPTSCSKVEYANGMQIAGCVRQQGRRASFDAQMIALQEELDWQCYQLYGLLDDDFCYHGERSSRHFALANEHLKLSWLGKWQMESLNTTWFERHGSTPMYEIPDHWPEDYRKLVERRIELIETNKEIGLIEKPEYKRRWNTESWDDQQQRALRNWLLDRLESQHLLARSQAARATSAIGRRVVGQGQRRSGLPASRCNLPRSRRLRRGCVSIAELVESESVPFLPISAIQACRSSQARGLGKDVGTSAEGRRW